SLGELFFPFFGNPELEPEESESFEAGARFDGRRWSFAATWFSTDFENLIDGDPLTFTAVNIGRAESRGVELAVGYRRGIAALRLGATALRTEDLASGEALLRRPEESADLVLTLRPTGWVIEAVARYVGDRDDLDPVTFARATNGDYLVGDLALTWEASARWSPYARLRNLTDEMYEEVLGFPAPGRTAIVGLEVELP
ncbi:MAG: TonB-dependent receptor, partial [Thermoanaerobaculia bacterium]|nr:TonB-dependent receptor [Thermoanaerobaculia bacterium]